MRKLHEIAADQDEDLTSRSDIKRARKVKEEALARLAKELVGLGERTLAKLELPEDVLDPVVDAQRIQSPIALERQLRVVRRALRDASWRRLLSSPPSVLRKRKSDAWSLMTIVFSPLMRLMR